MFQQLAPELCLAPRSLLTNIPARMLWYCNLKHVILAWRTLSPSFHVCPSNQTSTCVREKNIARKKTCKLGEWGPLFLSCCSDTYYKSIAQAWLLFEISISPPVNPYLGFSVSACFCVQMRLRLTLISRKALLRSIHMHSLTCLLFGELAAINELFDKLPLTASFGFPACVTGRHFVQLAPMFTPLGTRVWQSKRYTSWAMLGVAMPRH